MNVNYLDFEQPIAELQEKIEELRRVTSAQDINITDEITKLEKKSEELSRSIFSSLTPHQIVQMARHPLRPYSLDYFEKVFRSFNELQGDRHGDPGLAIVGGLAFLEEQPVMVIGHQKGRTTKQKLERNFGMASPEAFRKAQRLMELAERFHIPVITFIDTPGAYPGIEAEETNQSEAIAKNLEVMSALKTPIICVVIGEGCSGGALAIGVGDRILMLQYSYYSVISPEGCASILWRSAEKASVAAEALKLTAKDLKELGIVDEIVPEPLGGAHRDADGMAKTLKQQLVNQLDALMRLDMQQLLEQRYQKLMAIGR